MASDDTTAGEIKGLRQRLHELSNDLHEQGLKVATNDLEIKSMRVTVDTLSETTATREQLANASAIMNLKMDGVSSEVKNTRAEVAEVRRWIIAGVSIVLTGVILAVLALVIQAPR